MVFLYSVVGRISFDRYGTTRWRKRDWRICSIFLMLEGEVTSDYIVESVVGLHSSGEILGENQGKVVLGSRIFRTRTVRSKK